MLGRQRGDGADSAMNWCARPCMDALPGGGNPSEDAFLHPLRRSVTQPPTAGGLSKARRRAGELCLPARRLYAGQDFFGRQEDPLVPSAPYCHHVRSRLARSG
jgi:hypothetical protein